jgi:FkbM family methyltransferase
MLKHIDKLDSLRLKQSGGMYERQETALVKHLLKPDDIFVDVGAHIGYYTALAAEIVTDGDVMAYEPEPENYKILIKNIKKFNNVQCLPLGVGSVSGNTKLYVSKKNTGDHRLFESNNDKRNEINITLIKLEDSLPPTIDKVNFLKIDTQGFEIDVLMGARNIIENSQDISILLEYSPALLRLAGHSPGELIGMLIDMGFHIYQKAKEKWEYANTITYHHKKGQWHTNLFCSRKIHKEIDWGEK